MSLSQAGIQVFLATHSLFLLRELEILLANQPTPQVSPRFFGLHFADGSVVVNQGNAIDEIGNIAALDEDLANPTAFWIVKTEYDNCSCVST